MPQMASWRTAAFVLALGSLAAAGCQATGRPQPDPAAAPAAGPGEPAPEWATSAWANLVGTWVADNSAFRNEQDTNDAFGLEWRWGIGRQSLIGRLYGIRDGQEVATFWEFREFWHPRERRVITTQLGGDGTYGAGPHEIRADGTWEMSQTFFYPDERGTRRIGHRAQLEGDVYTTTSYDIGEDGAWTEGRTYAWHRQK